MKRLLVAILLLGSTLATAAQRPAFNDTPLRGLGGFWIQVILVPPSIARRAGIDKERLRTRLEEGLEGAGLLSRQPRPSDPVAAVHVDLDLVELDQKLYAWHLNLEVQEAARLERAPEAGIVMAVPWHRTMAGLQQKPYVAQDIEEALAHLVGSLVKAHERGGPPTR